MPEEDEESWHLVHFIRQLPELTSEELDQMEGLNPVSPVELEERMRIERFLAGEDLAPQQELTGGHEH